MPVTIVEAKRKNADVSAALQQAKRYSRGIHTSTVTELAPEPWGAFRIPIVFSANGRPQLRQPATRSGIWFCNLRRPENPGRSLDGWYTPEGLLAQYKRDEVAAHQRLVAAPLVYGLSLRHYQQAAIEAV